MEETDETAMPTGRGSADYVLRTAQQNLLQLSAMADQKASVVLGAAFVTATIVFGDVATDESLDPLRLVLLVTALGSGILAAVALAPRITKTPDHDQVLFFGSIATMPVEQYRQVMAEMLADDAAIYDAIVRDMHAASGVVLRSKFRPLQASYVVLVLGMIATFVIAITT